MISGKRFLIKKIHIIEDDIDIEGNFDTPPLAQLTMEDQIFVAAFVKTHGSIKQMESIFGISYPTVKNRLNSIAGRLDILDIEIEIKEPVSTILDRLERGEIDTDQALKEIK